MRRMFRAISFDCYGTLIDWQAGLLRAARPVLHRCGIEMDDAAIVRAFANAERDAERPPYIDYKEVLRRVMRALLEPRTAAAAATLDDIDTLWRSIPDWPAFPDTAASLRALQPQCKVCIVSNIDDDLFAATQPKLGITPDVLVTAQQVRSYKPAEPHFRELLRRLGCRPAEVLHVAESMFHDIEPAKRLGFRTVWVNRQGADASASGRATASVQPDMTVRGLADLVERLPEITATG